MYKYISMNENQWLGNGAYQNYYKVNNKDIYYEGVDPYLFKFFEEFMLTQTGGLYKNWVLLLELIVDEKDTYRYLYSENEEEKEIGKNSYKDFIDNGYLTHTIQLEDTDEFAPLIDCEINYAKVENTERIETLENELNYDDVIEGLKSSYNKQTDPLFPLPKNDRDFSFTLKMRENGLHIKNIWIMPSVFYNHLQV